MLVIYVLCNITNILCFCRFVFINYVYILISLLNPEVSIYVAVDIRPEKILSVFCIDTAVQHKYRKTGNGQEAMQQAARLDSMLMWYLERSSLTLGKYKVCSGD